MTIPEKVEQSGLDYDSLLAEYSDVYEQTQSHVQAGNHIVFLSEGWDGDELFTLPELLTDLKAQNGE